MKKHLIKKSLCQSLLSFVVLGIFLLLAVGSFDEILADLLIIVDTECLKDGNIKRTYYFSDYEEIITGKRDAYGRWQGPVKIETVYEGTGDVSTEEVTMLSGKRHGTSKTTHYNGKVVYREYNMGNYVSENKKSAHNITAYTSAFKVLNNKYPWFLLKLNALGFWDEYVEAYLDTLETVLNTFQFEDIEFDDYYQDVIDDLEWTAYDSIIGINSALRTIQGLEELKNVELRLAVIDSYRSDGKSTYNIVEATYPYYLFSINDAGVNDKDFEGFCQDLDSCLTSYGSLDQEDPFFTDSIDARMFRALEYIYETGESSLKSMSSMKNTIRFNDIKSSRRILGEVNSTLQQLILKSSPSDVVEVVGTLMLSQFGQGDIIKRSVREAYLINKGVIKLPIVTTEFLDHNSATSVTLNGYVLEDGGAAITSRGIAWANFYNPTTNDNTETSGTGTEDFSVTLTGLTEGAAYYARTYATNSAGTAYGNCISFISTSAVGIDQKDEITQDFIIYPNPVSGMAIFSFQVESFESMVLTIVNLKGQVVYQSDLNNLPPGENQIQLDLSGLENGLYNSLLTIDGKTKGACKLILAR